MSLPLSSMGASAAARQPFKRPARPALRTLSQPPAAVIAEVERSDEEAEEPKVESGLGSRRRPRQPGFDGLTLRNRAQIAASKRAEHVEAAAVAQEAAEPALRRSLRSGKAPVPVLSEIEGESDDGNVRRLRQTPAPGRKGKALLTPVTLKPQSDAVREALSLDSQRDDEDDAAFGCEDVEEVVIGDFDDEERVADEEDNAVAEMLAELDGLLDDDESSEDEEVAVKTGSGKRTRSKTSTKKGKGGKAGSSKKRRSSRATLSRTRKTVWRLSDFESLDLGKVAVDLDEIKVDEDDLARFDARVKFTIKKIVEVSKRQLNRGRRSFAWSTAGLARSLGAERIWELFQKHTPAYRRAPFGIRDLQEHEVAWRAIPAPSDAELNGKGVYSSRAGTGRYKGSGTAESARYSPPGMGQRLWAYEKLKRRAEDGHQLSMSNKKSRHVRMCCANTDSWRIRVVSVFDADTPPALVQLIEGIWAVVEQTVSYWVPPEGAQSQMVQNDDSVAATKECVEPEYLNPSFVQLNGASPLSQGCRNAKTCLRKLAFDSVGGICSLCNTDLPAVDVEGYVGEYYRSTVPGYVGDAVHRACQRAWHQMQSGLHPPTADEFLSNRQSRAALLEEKTAQEVSARGVQGRQLEREAAFKLIEVSASMLRCPICERTRRSDLGKSSWQLMNDEEYAKELGPTYHLQTRLVVNCNSCVRDWRDNYAHREDRLQARRDWKESRMGRTAGAAKQGLVLDEAMLEHPEMKAWMAGRQVKADGATLALYGARLKQDHVAPCCGQRFPGDKQQWTPIPEDLADLIGEGEVMPYNCLKNVRNSPKGPEEYLELHRNNAAKKAEKERRE